MIKILNKKKNLQTSKFVNVRYHRSGKKPGAQMIFSYTLIYILKIKNFVQL